MLDVSYRCESLSLFSYSLVCFSCSSILTRKLPVILVYASFRWNQQKSVKCLKKAEVGIRLLFVCDKRFFPSTSAPSIPLACCTPLNGGVLCNQGKMKLPHCYCSTNKTPFPLPVLKITFDRVKSHLFNYISFSIFLFEHRQDLVWMLWNAFSLSSHQLG